MEKNQKNWNNLFGELTKFYEKYKRTPTKKDSAKLYTWCAVQRLKKKKKVLSQDKIDKLESINFIWNVQDHIWDKNFETLVNYRKENPDRWPSQRSKEAVEHKLAVWFLGIRKDYKRNKLAPQRITKLKSIGFPFHPREYRWERTFQVLEKWLKEKKIFPDRSSRNLEEQKLFNWCRYQVIKKNNKVLDDYQIEKLKGLGIDRFEEEMKQYEEEKKEFSSY